jgi:hypothetical protein
MGDLHGCELSYFIRTTLLEVIWTSYSPLYPPILLSQTITNSLLGYVLTLTGSRGVST